MKKTLKKSKPFIDGPLLDSVRINLSDNAQIDQYPFSLNIIKNLKEITFSTQVTFFVGENGSGKSTILEAIAFKSGFGLEGGSKNIQFKTSQEKTYIGTQNLADSMTLSWRHKPPHGYFFRAESFFNVANYLDQLATLDYKAYDSYGGKSLHEQSHGEGFLSFFNNALSQDSFFILDEPEAALSPERQLSLLVIINELCKKSDAQFIIATHSPILLAYPNATIYSCDAQDLEVVSYTETHHYQITKAFLDNPENYLRRLFRED